MAQNPDAIAAMVEQLTQPEARGRLLALGLARGMVWRDGVVPEGAPNFPPQLTDDLLDFGYGLLALGLELRDVNRELATGRQFATEEAFRVAAEALESAVRRGSPGDPDRGRHLVVCAAAFHLAGYAARSFSILPSLALDLNLASHERVLGMLLRRDLHQMRSVLIQWHLDPAHSDDGVSARLLNVEDSFGAEDAVMLALSTAYHRALGLADSALLLGDRDVFELALTALEEVVANAGSIGNIPTWWVATLTIHIVRDLWSQSLHTMLPPDPRPEAPGRWRALRRDFIALLGTRRPPQMELWPSQLTAAMRSIDPDDDLVIALPTSAGKTRVAELCLLRTLADGRRAVYVTPLRALSAQVERVLGRTFVPLDASVTSLYGASGATSSDVSTLATASIVVATPEKLDFALRQDPDVLNDVGLIVFDEGHMIGLGSREIRYEVLIQRLLRRSDSGGRRIVCLSAMFNPDDPYFADFGNWLRSDAAGDSVHVQWRPTRQRFATLDWSEHGGSARLGFRDGERPFVPRFVEGLPARARRKNAFPQNDKEFCVSAANAFARDGHTVLVYSPQRSQIEPIASEFRKAADQGYLTHIRPPSPEHLMVAQAIGREWLGVNHAAMKALEVGVGTHHGTLPRPFLSAIEELLDRKHLSVVVASPTLAQGVDLACSVLIFRSIQRYEKGGWRPMGLAEFANVVGRVGRAFVDIDGITVLPTFEVSKRASQHALFQKLIDNSRGQRLLSGIAQLIWQIAQHLTESLSVPKSSLVEYVMNNSGVWDDVSAVGDDDDEDDDDRDESLEERLADLDVAIFSLIEPLNVDVSELATLLDQVLRDSLWRRTLAHGTESQRLIEEALLRSRAEWLWKTTTTAEREACFYSGLGKAAGVFLYSQLDTLVDKLATFQAAVARRDDDALAAAAVAFAERVMSEPQFSVRRLPEHWQAALASWVKGTAVAEILAGRPARDARRIEAFLQDGVVFRLVWAAEAVRSQATKTAHTRADELGDGPAFALTYGVSSIQAALLCQLGFASRVGAMWLSRQLSATVAGTESLRLWLRANEAFLSDPEFWESADHHLLWTHMAAHSRGDAPRLWTRRHYRVKSKWSLSPPLGERVRVITSASRTATICSLDLVPLGEVRLPFDPYSSVLDAEVGADESLKIEYFGPN
ncbi:MAG: DEAD/DEAH box helicase [Vicinamibacterales bacterium]|nr:DEAD/DEAH box helicase [Vicinamibacterales bacterium]